MLARIGRAMPSWKRAAVEALPTAELFSLYERVFGFLDPISRRRLMALAAERERGETARPMGLAA
jgi:hypothetical protein